MDSKEIRDLVQAYVKANKKLLGTISESIVELGVGVGYRYFLGIGICIISALVFF